MSTSSEPDFRCDAWAPSVCAGEPLYARYEGRNYCVLHFPAKDKIDDFDQALQRKIKNKDFNFTLVWFPPGPSFRGFEFSAVANFRYATFSRAIDFSGCTFSAGADFSDTAFRAPANFSDARFSGAVFFDRA